jgi:hypothetical protein
MATLGHRPTGPKLVLPMTLLEPPDLTGQIERVGEFPLAGGGFADVWRGVWSSGSDKRQARTLFLCAFNSESEIMPGGYQSTSLTHV